MIKTLVVFREEKVFFMFKMDLKFSCEPLNEENVFSREKIHFGCVIKFIKNFVKPLMATGLNEVEEIWKF